MNVLVYSGPGVSQTSLLHTLSCLKSLLLPHFAVQTITAPALVSQPWSGSCALLVIPGGRDLPYVASLANANPSIRSYVEQGGAYLGICAGAYYASRRIEWETGTKLEISGERPLGFFDGVCKGSVYPGFAYESESGARAVSIEDVETGEIVRGMYHNGGGEFLDADHVQNTKVIARYMDDEGEEKVAAVQCKVRKGTAILWGAHPEYPLIKEPLLSALQKRDEPLTDEELKTSEERRWELMRKSLLLLGLHLPSPGEDPNKSYTSPLPQFLTSRVPTLPTRIYDILSPQCPSAEPNLLRDRNDTFKLRKASEAPAVLQEARSRPESEDNLQLPKDVIFYEDGTIPEDNLTPKFFIRKYYSCLTDARSSLGAPSLDMSDSWGMGELFMYGEAVTSTQTLLDQNPILFRSLPTPLLSLASHQLSGRGRGSNTWLSPSGCLQFSLLLRPSFSQVPASRLVFLQYLFALAVVEACQKLLGNSGERVRLKWPNDIYAVVDEYDDDGRTKQEKKKIGGVLVNTNISEGRVDLVVGCGLNVLNPLPTTALSQLTTEKLSMEKTMATIMVVFEGMWNKFVENRGSFEPFMELYLERWLHSDQLVTLTTVSPPISVRVLGITSDYGLLRTVPEGGRAVPGEFIDLQPDGNSFDMMAGLIKRKM